MKHIKAFRANMDNLTHILDRLLDIMQGYQCLAHIQ